MKQTIKLRESELRRMIAESVRRILRESDERHAWDLTDDGVEEFSMDGNWPSDRWDNEHNWDRRIGKGANALRMGLDQQSGNDWKQGSVYDNPYAQDKRENARDYVNKGKYYPYGFGSQLWDDYAEDDLEDFNNAEQRKMAAADKRWQRAADSRPLHRKGSLNRAMDESINRIVSECLKRNLR